MAASVRRKHLVIAGIVLALIVLVGWLVSSNVRAWYHHREAQAALARRDFSATREQMQRCLRLAPSDVEYLLLAAQTTRRDGDLAEASRLLDRASAARADPDAVSTERWMLRLQSGDLKDAEKAFHVCLERPDLADAALMLEALVIGSLRTMHLSLAHRCIDLWMEREQSTPARVQGLIWRGDEAIRRGAGEQALGHYREAMDLDPDSDQARQRAAAILVRVDAREALRHLTLLRQKRPNDPGLRLLLARCRHNLGEHEEARRLLADLFDESPQDVDVLLQRGEVELDLRRTDEAERWFRRAEELAPEKRETNLALARCLQVAGKDDEAQNYRQRVERIDAELQKRIDTLFEPSPK